VLIVDDNATNRQILRKQLSSWGMESAEAEDGFAALEELREAAREAPPTAWRSSTCRCRAWTACSSPGT
jgi:CheY-like chemotaxis protein